MTMSEEARLFYRVWSDDYGLHLFREQGGWREIAAEITWRPVVEGERHAKEPALRLSVEATKRLMDDLWASGIRPTETRHAEGVAKHLEDMRAIAFAKLNIVKP